MHNQQFDGHFLMLRRSYNEPFTDVTKLIHLKEYDSMSSHFFTVHKYVDV